jgi:hypothetical protein
MTVIFKGLLKFRGLIDTGAEINVMTKKIYASLLSLVMIENPEMVMIFHSNHYIPFLGVCEDVRVIVKDFKYNVCIFVIDFQANYVLVLGAPFISQLKFNLAIKEESGK